MCAGKLDYFLFQFEVRPHIVLTQFRDCTQMIRGEGRSEKEGKILGLFEEKEEKSYYFKFQHSFKGLIKKQFNSQK